MEPADAKMKVKYTVIVRVNFVTHREYGWFVHFEGSHESIFLGQERPKFNPGDTVRITFERISDAKS
jgi:hypothetical protein